jgi:hypothetical protein
MAKNNLISLKPLFSFLGLSIIPRIRIEMAEIQRDNMDYALDLHERRRMEPLTSVARKVAGVLDEQRPA